MYTNMLPNGTVVRLKDGERYLMIMGRVIAGGEPMEIYDYVGCLFPEGMTDFGEGYFFNKEDIDEIVFVGFQDDRELSFRHEVLDRLKPLAIKDGTIVPADEV